MTHVSIHNILYIMLNSSYMFINVSFYAATFHVAGFKGGRMLYYLVVTAIGELVENELVGRGSFRTGVGSKVLYDPNLLKSRRKYWQRAGKNRGQ